MYYEQLNIAKQEIDNYGHASYHCVRPRIWSGSFDFPGYEAEHITATWTRKLRNEIADYERIAKHRKVEESGWAREEEDEEDRSEQERKENELARKQSEKQIAELRRATEELQRQNNRNCSLNKLMGAPYNFDASLAEDFIDEDGDILEKKLSAYQNTIKSTNLLMSEPYNMSEEEAKKYICKDGEINKVALTQFENTRKNKELIAKKLAEWEAQKTKPTEVTNNSTVCPSCGNPSGVNDKYCRACGTPIQKQCPSCKKLLPANNKFCSACGTKL